MNERPDSWADAQLGDIARVEMGQSPDSRFYNDHGEGLPFFQGKAEFGMLYPTARKWCSVPTRIAEVGDILMSVRAPVGPTNLASEKCCIGRGLAAIRADEPVTQKYLLHYLRHIQPWLSQQGTGTTFAAISGDFLRSLTVELAPTNEQKRIADKLDALLARVDACRERLDRVPLILKRFRQAVLAAATSGRLTEDWREANPDIASARKLLGEILEARSVSATRQAERSQLEKIAEGLSLDTDRSPDLPASWIATRVGSIGYVCNGSTPSRKVPGYWNGDIPWVSSGEVQNCIITGTRERITQEGYDNSSVRLLPKGTVLLAMIGEGRTRGQSAILSLPACINQNIAGIVIDHGLVESKYLWYWFQGEYKANRQAGSGSGPQALNCQSVRDLPFHLAPLPEQQDIVHRVETLFTYADRLEARYQAARARVERLTPSLLAKAFRGELVPQDPDDEPAAVLLERIRAARVAQPAKPKKASSQSIRRSVK